MIISEYSNENRTRTAKVMSGSPGSYRVLMIDLWNDDYAERYLENCTLQYAQDLAENFVMGWGEFK